MYNLLSNTRSPLGKSNFPVFFSLVLSINTMRESELKAIDRFTFKPFEDKLGVDLIAVIL